MGNNLQVQGSSVGDKIGNFFANMLDADTNALKGGLDVLEAPLGLLEGHTPNFKAIAGAYENFGLSTANAFTGGHAHSSLGEAGEQALTAAQQSLKNLDSKHNIFNAEYANFSGSVSNATRAPYTGASTSAPPSSLAQISNPNVKMAMSSARGGGRNMMVGQMNVNDAANSHNLPQNPLSKNQAGGTGVPNLSGGVSFGQQSQTGNTVEPFKPN